MSALPSPPLGLVLDNSSLRIAVGLRLGTQLCHPHRCRCGEDVDRYGTHGLCCSKKGGKRIGTFSRHSAINEILRQAFNKINVPTQLEPPVCSGRMVREQSDSDTMDGRKEPSLGCYMHGHTLQEQRFMYISDSRSCGRKFGD